MIYREYYDFVHKKATGLFRDGNDHSNETLIGGSHPIFQPIVKDIWKQLNIPFTISTRSGVRIEFDTYNGSITAWSLVHGYLKDSLTIEFDFVDRTVAQLSTNYCDDTIDVTILTFKSHEKNISIVFGENDRQFFISVNTSPATALNDICLKCWDLNFTNCNYKVNGAY